MIDAAEKPVPKQIIAHAGSVSIDTLNRWLKREKEGGVFKEFAENFKRARAKAGQELAEMAMLDGDALKLLQISFNLPDPDENKNVNVDAEINQPIDLSHLSDDQLDRLEETLDEIQK
jgi:DNA topoisomerase VI subunit B